MWIFTKTFEYTNIYTILLANKIDKFIILKEKKNKKRSK